MPSGVHRRRRCGFAPPTLAQKGNSATVDCDGAGVQHQQPSLMKQQGHHRPQDAKAKHTLFYALIRLDNDLPAFAHQEGTYLVVGEVRLSGGATKMDTSSTCA